MIRIVLRVVAGLVLVVIAIVGLQMIASESGEVVVLHSTDAQGQSHETRLWVVDYEGSAFLRVGAGGSGWYSRLQGNPRARVERQGEAGDFVIVPRPQLSDAINDLMSEKYGWADSYISATVAERTGSIPLQLQPVD